MSRPIVLTEETINILVEEFRAQISKGERMPEGELKYSRDFTYKDYPNARVIFEPAAFTKMIHLINSFSSEVGWHGVCKRSEDRSSDFIVSDILVFPQIVTGSTVTPDNEEYTKWLLDLPDEVCNNQRFHGHSHVNMGVTPSAVDTSYQSDILAQLGNDMFYVFMIWNKKMEFWCKIFDLANNTLYQKTDIDVYVGDPTDFDEFGAQAEALVKQKTYTAPTTTYSGRDGVYSGSAKTAPKPQPVKDTKSQSKGAKANAKNKAAAHDDEGYDYYDRLGYGYNWRDKFLDHYAK